MAEDEKCHRVHTEPGKKKLLTFGKKDIKKQDRFITSHYGPLNFELFNFTLFRSVFFLFFFTAGELKTSHKYNMFHSWYVSIIVLLDKAMIILHPPPHPLTPARLLSFT